MTRFNLSLSFATGAACLWLLTSADASGQETATASGPGKITAINDRKIRAQFVQGLGRLKEDGKTPSPGKLREQLKRRAYMMRQPLVADEHATVLSAADIYRNARKATLVFGNIYKCNKCERWHPSLSGAVVIDPSGIAVTNHHVMDKEKAAAFGAMTADGRVVPVIEVLAASDKDDLAIVSLGGENFDAVPISTGDPVGSEIKVISHPAGRFYTFSEGAIARYYLEPGENSMRMQITADYARGSSGCGVFNESGALTGIVASTNSIYHVEKEDVQQNLQMVVKSCVPVASVRKLIESAEAQSESESSLENN